MQRFKNILCVMEHGEAGKPALEWAVTLAENNQASLTVIDVIPQVPSGIGMPDGGPISRDLQTAMVREHEARIVSLLELYRQRLDVKHGVLMGTAFLEIIRAVLRNGHDLVIKCPESPSWLDRFFSGDDMHLLRKCPCPVWLVKPQAPKTYQPNPSAERVGTQGDSGLGQTPRCRLHRHGHGGAHGHPRFHHGQHGETILEQIECSVLAIKPPGFVTPVALED